MPPTLVHAALGALLAAAVLGRALDARGAAVVAGAAAFPDLDMFLALVEQGLHGAVLHTVFLPAALAALLYHDTNRRAVSVVRARWGAYGVAVAWTAILAYAVAGIGLDVFNVAAAAPFWPVDRSFYVVVGRLGYTTHEGFVQTFVGLRWGWPPLVFDTYPSSFWVRSPVDPTRGPDPTGVERVVVLVESGWQLLVVLTSAGALGVTLGGEE